MRYRIEITKRANRNYEKLDNTLRQIIDDSLKELCDYYDNKTNKKPDVRALKGKYKGFYRLREGIIE
jgi:mRNA-degrading endonuclease RelE of RelBE toxin-antitoxin system